MKYANLIFAVLFMLFSASIVGQPQGEPTDITPVPLDGGLAFLLAAGGAYGIKKYREK